MIKRSLWSHSRRADSEKYSLFVYRWSRALIFPPEKILLGVRH